jgi:hypothetical protein
MKLGELSILADADAPSYVCWFMLTPLPISISPVNPIVDLEVFLLT